MQQVLHDLPLTLAYIGADLVALMLLVGALYIPRHGRRDLVAAYIGVNVGVLAVTLLLSTSDNVGAGLGLGLFGVLSIIRLRSSSLAQGEVAYFFAALALGLLGGIKTHLIIVTILMALILASLWVGDHPALMRRNRNQTVTLDRAISNENELITELEITNHSLKKVNGKVEALTETTRVKNQFTDAYGRRTARVDMMCPTITDAAATAGFRIFGRYTPVRAIKEVTFVPYDADAGIDDSWLAAWAVYLDIGHCIRHEGRFGDHEGVTANYHISKIKHKLTPSRWEVTYELMLLNGVNPYG